ASPAVHAEFPERAITMVVPTAAGGGNDTLARVIGQKMGELLGQTVIVVNKPGAQGAIAADYVARQPADGYTLMLGYIGT
ncbi:tripartite tricarboxylate transporter substrate-binding protein, partial [Burkholderia sp. SIMBA_042]